MVARRARRRHVIGSAAAPVGVLCVLALAGCTSYSAPPSQFAQVDAQVRAELDRLDLDAQTNRDPAIRQRDLAESILLRGRYIEWLDQRARGGASSSEASSGDETVYSPDQCIGAVVMGRCHGSIMPDGDHHPTCHGQMLNGQCTGPMF